MIVLIEFSYYELDGEIYVETDDPERLKNDLPGMIREAVEQLLEDPKMKNRYITSTKILEKLKEILPKYGHKIAKIPAISLFIHSLPMWEYGKEPEKTDLNKMLPSDLFKKLLDHNTEAERYIWREVRLSKSKHMKMKAKSKRDKK